MMSENQLVGYVLVHPRNLGMMEFLNFDLIVHKDHLNKFEDDDWYCADCVVAKEFMKDKPDYELLGSEDFGHTHGCNFAILHQIVEYVKRGCELVYVEE